MIGVVLTISSMLHSEIDSSNYKLSAVKFLGRGLFKTMVEVGLLEEYFLASFGGWRTLATSTL